MSLNKHEQFMLNNSVIETGGSFQESQPETISTPDTAWGGILVGLILIYGRP